MVPETSRQRERRVGILGGTFDPVHYGHLAIIRQAEKQLCLDRILLIPAYVPPHKTDYPVSSFSDRLAMLRLALGNVSSYTIATLEAERDGPSYTIDTLRSLRQQYGREVAFFFSHGY